MSTIKNFEDIEAWKLARQLSKELFQILKREGISKNYRLKDQIEGSSGSTMDNIAEGFERGGNKEFINFLGIAKGSSGELRSQIHRLYDREYISEKEYYEYLAKSREISSRLSKFITYFKII